MRSMGGKKRKNNDGIRDIADVQCSNSVLNRDVKATPKMAGIGAKRYISAGAASKARGTVGGPTPENVLTLPLNQVICTHSLDTSTSIVKW